MLTPTEYYLELAKRVLRYLKHTINLKLIYKPKLNNQISSFCDTDYANDGTTSKSINGICTVVYNCLVNWTSQKQNFYFNL